MLAWLQGISGLTVPEPVLYFVRDFGLTLFVYFIGLQVGPSFFSSFKSGGMLLNLLTLLLVVLGLLLTIGLYFLFSDQMSLAQMLGVHYGAVTNTPGLGATQEALDMLNYQGENIAVAYACAYPLGVVGTILCAVILRKLFKIKLSEEDAMSGTTKKRPYTTNRFSFTLKSPTLRSMGEASVKSVTLLRALLFVVES